MEPKDNYTNWPAQPGNSRKDMITHRVIAVPGTQGRQTDHIAEFTYPDGVRTFDGRVWTWRASDAQAL